MRDPELLKAREIVQNRTQSEFSIRGDGMLLFQGRVCVPAVAPMKEMILQEAHNSPYAMHPRSIKMYRTLRPHYWWNGMKRDIAEFVARCLVCQ